MHIQFVIEYPVLTGGVRVVYEHSRQLIGRGHRVSLLIPPPRILTLLGGSALAWKRYLHARLRPGIRDALASYGLSSNVVAFDPDRPESAPSADVVVATAWVTAEWVASLPDRCGRRFYLIQHYEAHTPDLRARVDATWTLPLQRIVIAGWLQRLARERFGVDAARIPNGVDAVRFHPRTGPSPSGVTVGMIYDALPFKGAADGLEALRRVREEMPDVDLLLFGRGRRRHEFPSGTRPIWDPPQAVVPGVYRSCDVFLSSSHSEGFSLVTLEAMASGCALVATAVGEVPEMGQPGMEYLMVPPHQPVAMADAVIGLLRDHGLRARISAAGVALARRYSWARATDMLEAVLKGT